jgi:hypothetical protein
MAINTQKFLPQGGKGGSLAVRPKTNLAPIKKQNSSLAKVGGKQEDPMLVIKTKVIKIEDLLKGTLAAEKKAADEKRKQKEQEDRSKQEDEVEAPKTKGKGIKLPIPGKIKSFWGNIKKFIGTVLFGWLALQLLPLIPKLMPILKMLAATADFIINWGGKILSGLVTFVDWGYKAVEGTRKFIENKFGEDAAEKFDSFMGTINKVLNLVVALGMGAAAMGRGKKPPKGPKGTKQPKRSIKNKLKRTKKLMKRPFDPKRADKLKRVKNIKKIRADKLARTKKIGRLRKIAKAKKFVGKTTKAVSKTTKAVGKNVGKATKVVGKNVTKATKAVSKTTQAVGKNVSKVSGKVSQSAGKIVSRLGMKMNKGMVQSMKGLSKMAKGVRIPIIGPILAAITSYLADGKLDKALFIGIGTALGEMLGSAIPIPVLGTLIGGAIGFYIGDLLYTLFRGGGVKAVINKLKEDLKKVFNVGKAIFNWSKMGLGRLWEGLPKIGIGKLSVPNPAWLFNPGNMLGKVKLIGKAFFSRDPMKEEKDDKKGDGKKDKKKLSKEFAIGKKKFDLSKLQGGLTREEYDDLSNKDRGILDRRLRMYASQNPKGSANNIVSTNGVSNKASSVSSSASYEEGSDKEIVVVNTKNNSSMGSNQPTEEGKVVAVETGSGSGSGSDATASLYRG